MNTLLAFFAAVFVCQLAQAASLTENKQWNSFFENESVTGVFVLCKGSANSCVTNDKVRAEKAFLPASTFKIANALIALETGVVKDERQVFKWDGKPRAMKQWEKDFTLRGAIQASAFPVFQQFAREIGAKSMQDYLLKFGYGNADIGGDIDHFWLDGQLRISASGQLHFLESLYLNRLPVSNYHQLVVKDALVSEATAEYLIRSKTGYTGITDTINPGIAWWVGWIEKGTEVYFFALNMDVSKADQLPARKAIPLKILQQQAVLPAG